MLIQQNDIKYYKLTQTIKSLKKEKNLRFRRLDNKSKHLYFKIL